MSGVSHERMEFASVKCTNRVGDLMPRDQRLYMTFPIDFWTHPKVSRLSDAAFRAFVEANGHSRMRESDGLIEADDAEFLWRPDVLAELVTSHPSRPLMVRSDAGEYVLRDYAEHQFTKADRDKLSVKRADAARIGAEKRAKAKQVPASAEQVLSNSEQTAAGIGIGKEIRKEEPKSISTPAARGTRLTDSWQPSADLLAWARLERTDIDPVKESDNFRDYWIAQPGAKGVKADWDRTFKNWIRNARGRGGSGVVMPADRMRQTLSLVPSSMGEIA